MGAYVKKFDDVQNFDSIQNFFLGGCAESVRMLTGIWGSKSSKKTAVKVFKRAFFCVCLGEGVRSMGASIKIFEKVHL